MSDEKKESIYDFSFSDEKGTGTYNDLKFIPIRPRKIVTYSSNINNHNNDKIKGS